LTDHSQVTAVEALLDCLEQEGVRCIFGVPGGPLTAFFEALRRRPGIRFVLAKHEEGAAFMANSYARVTRGLAVCCVTSGPGATNALTGVASANADSLPVLVLTGQVSTRAFGKGAIQESTSFGVDVVDIMKQVTKLSMMIPTAERTPDLVRYAARAAMSGRHGPVHLSLPADIATQPVVRRLVPPSRYRAVTAAPVDLDAIDHAARILVNARRPSLLAGHGAALAGAATELRLLAELLAIPVATSPKGKGVFPENHPLSLGVFGLGGHRLADRYFLTDDVLLVVGSSLNEFSSSAWDERLIPSAALVQIDIEPSQIGCNYPVDVAIIGDARAALSELFAAVGRLLARGAPDRDSDPLRELRADTPRWDDEDLMRADTRPLKPHRLMHELRAAMPDEAALFVDAGSAIIWGGHYFEARRPDTYFIDLGLACMGSAVAGAVGGALAAPGRATVCLTGDAAFAMHGAEVHTAVEARVPVTWVVLNNGGHGMVSHGERLLFGGTDLGYASFRVPIDAAAFARALGARGTRVDSAAAFRAALEEALTLREPTVIDAVIDDTSPPPTLARRAESLARFFRGAP
jgi:acetolactate synthase-1/2/3 large subunit